jgi:hypothetical protein
MLLIPPTCIMKWGDPLRTTPPGLGSLSQAKVYRTMLTHITTHCTLHTSSSERTVPRQVQTHNISNFPKFTARAETVALGSFHCKMHGLNGPASSGTLTCIRDWPEAFEGHRQPNTLQGIPGYWEGEPTLAFFPLIVCFLATAALECPMWASPW